MRVPRFGGRTSSFLKFLLLLLIVSFVLQTIVEAVVDKDAYDSFFLWTGFTPEGFLSGKLWTLISYACLHEGPWHLVLNLLAVFFMVFLTVFSTALPDDFFWFFFDTVEENPLGGIFKFIVENNNHLKIKYVSNQLIIQKK